MAVCIVANSAVLCKFARKVRLPLSKPQWAHFVNLVDALITVEGRKTVTALNAAVQVARCQFSACDFVGQSPWSVEAVRLRVLETQLKEALRRHPGAEVLISCDDTHAPKYRHARALEGADWHFDHLQGRTSFGYVVVSVHVTVGSTSFAADWRLYLRVEKVRELNRGRGNEEPLTFRSKPELVQEMLEDLAPLLSKERKRRPVYVLFDSWYASAALIGFCRGLGYHVICALRSNRVVDGKRLSQKRLRNSEYTPTVVCSAQSQTTYHTSTYRGTVRGVGEVTLVVSKRKLGGGPRRYFLCTNSRLSAQGALNRYAQRYGIETDYLYLKDRLGATEFRQRKLEAVEKYLTLSFMALSYLQWRKAQGRVKAATLAEVMRQHREEHLRQLLKQVAEAVLAAQSIKPALALLEGLE